MMHALSGPKRHTHVLAASAALSSNCAFADRPCSASSCARRSCGLAVEVNVASGTAAPSRRTLAYGTPAAASSTWSSPARPTEINQRGGVSRDIKELLPDRGHRRRIQDRRDPL